MNVFGQVEVQLHTFLTIALDRGEWSALCPSYFNPRERTLITHRRVSEPQNRAGYGGKERKSLPC